MKVSKKLLSLLLAMVLLISVFPMASFAEEVEQVNVVVVNQDGTQIWSGTAPKGEHVRSWLDANVAAKIAKEGYTFGAWLNKDSGAEFAADATFRGWTNVKVVYTAEQCVISVKEVVNGDKNNAKTIAQAEVDYGTDLITWLNANVTLETRTGYELDKWYNWDWFGNKFEDGKKVKGWTNVYVTYTSGEYKMYFEANEGKVDPAYVAVSYGKEIGALPMPTKDGYAFRGWFWDKECTKMVDTSAKYDKAADCTVYAKWAVKETVKLHIYENGKLTGDPIKTIDVPNFIKGDVIDLTKFNVGNYFKPDYKFTVKAFYNDGAWNELKAGGKPASLTSIEVNGWTNLYVVITKGAANEKADPTNPKTGDMIGVSLALMMSTGGAALMLGKKRK